MANTGFNNALVYTSGLSKQCFCLAVANFPPRWTGFKPESGYVGFVADKATVTQVFSGYFGSLAKHSLIYSILLAIVITNWYNRP
jgi:hypothetical protein